MSTKKLVCAVLLAVSLMALASCGAATSVDVTAEPTAAKETAVPTQAVEAPTGEAKPLNICVTFDKMGAYREGNKYYLDKAAKELGVNIDFYVAGEDAQKQSAQVDTCIAKKADGIIVNPWDIQAVLQDIDRAHEAGIIIGTMGQYPAKDDTTDFLYTANCYADGKMLGDWLVQNHASDPINLVNLQGSLSHDCGVLRDKGLKEAIAGHDNIKIIMDCPTEWRPEPALACMENALQAYPDLNAVYAATDGLIPPVLSALQTAGKLKKVGEPGHVIIMSIDGDPQGCTAVRDGYMDAGIAAGENPNSGRQAIEAIIKIKKTGQRLPDAERIIMNEGYLYTPGNLQDVKGMVWGCVIGEAQPAPTAPAPTETPAASAGDGTPLNICVTFDKMGAYREGNKYYLDKAAKELGVNIDFYVAGEDAQKQSAQVDTCIAKKADGIIVNPWDIQAVLQDIDRAHEAGIIIGTMGQYPAKDDTTDFLYTANCYADGKMLGDWLVQNHASDPINLVNLQGSLSHDCGVLRDKGLKEAIAGHDNIKIIMDCPTEWRPEPALACMENALQAYPDLNAVYAATDGLIPPVLSALQTAGKLKKVGEPGHVIIMSIDGDPQGCTAVRDGYMDAGIAAGENPNSGRQAIEAIIKIKKTGQPLPDNERIIMNEGYLYTPGNLQDVKDMVWGCVIGGE